MERRNSSATSPRRRVSRGLALSAALTLAGVGCGDDELRGLPDGGPPDGGTPDAARPAQALPVLTPCPSGDRWQERFDESLGLAVCELKADESPIQWACPEGWRAVLEGGVQSCEPFPESGPAPCAKHEAHFPGTPGCVAVGAACPSGAFPEGLPLGANIVYVRPGSRGGDGSSPDLPLESLDQIDFTSLPAGTIVALGKGEHHWTGVLRRSVTLWGACAEETVLTSPTEPPMPLPPALVTAAGSDQPFDIGLRNLRIVDGLGQAGLLVGEHAQVDVAGVIVADASGVGVWIQGGQLTGSDLVVRGTQPTSVLPGRGLDVLFEGTAELRRVVVDRNHSSGVLTSVAGSRLKLEDAVIRETSSRRTGRGGLGVQVLEGAAAELYRVVVEGNRDAALLARDSGSRLELEDALVRDTRVSEAGPPNGVGLLVDEGATAVVHRVAFVRNHTVGLLAHGTSTKLILDDVEVRDTLRPEVGAAYGRALEALEGAHVEARRIAFHGFWDVGIYASGVGTNLALEDLQVRSDDPMDDSPQGLSVTDGAVVELRRATFAQPRGGLYVFDERSRLLLEDALILDTAREEMGRLSGRGIQVENGRAEVRRTRIVGSGDVGINVEGSTATLLLQDVIVQDTRSPTWGFGLAVQNGATLDGARNLVAGVQLAGVYATNGTVDLADTVVRDVTLAPCADLPSPCGAFGSGLVSTGTSSIRLERVQVDQVRQCGLYALNGGEIDGADVVVTNSGVGACLEDPLYDVNRLGAEFAGNNQSIAYESLPGAPSQIDIGN